MKLSKLLGTRFKEIPSDCQINSHIYMVRGGYIKNVSNGIYSLYNPGKLIVQKIEKIIREEMSKIDGQEVMLPVILPASLWKESGRYESVGSELLRFTDRNGSDMVLAMTHEEAILHLVRDAAPSYLNYPFMVYHIQTKFRDEPRSRGGLIRVREFTMKDAYSFHLSQEDLEEYYQRCYEAYEQIFRRVGLKDVIAVKSDTGMMGGNIAHEFMLLSEVGEDTLVICKSCDYRSNLEVSECIVASPDTTDEALTLVETPNIKKIEDLCAFFKVTPDKTCKAVLYRTKSKNKLVVVFIRGDLDVNETKLRNLLKEEIFPDTSQETDLNYGFIGPVNFTAESQIVFDRSIKNINGLIAGANRADFHYRGFSTIRDIQNTEYFDVAKSNENSLCPHCNQNTLQIRKGIELGNIFQLGTKYTESMNMQYMDANRNLQYPIMGCYGIGVGRLAASICEAHHDNYGPIWPMSVAPWQIHICAIRSDNEDVKKQSNELYEQLIQKGFEVIFDDRNVSAGVMFSDADLLGVPVRVVISPKTCDLGVVEISTRNKSLSEKVDAKSAFDYITDLVMKMM